MKATTEEIKAKVRASLAYYDRRPAWLAQRLAISEKTCYRRMNDGKWGIDDFILMAQLFHWDATEVLKMLGVKARKKDEVA